MVVENHRFLRGSWAAENHNFNLIGVSLTMPELGFDDRHVFHSIRKTVVTILENAGVPENIVADIVGHEKKSMTFGLYSAGASLAVKAEALAKLQY